MKETLQDLLTGRGGSNIFDLFASTFTRLKISGEAQNEFLYERIENSIEKIERGLQDLSERYVVEYNAQSNLYDDIIRATKDYLARLYDKFLGDYGQVVDIPALNSLHSEILEVEFLVSSDANPSVILLKLASLNIILFRDTNKEVEGYQSYKVDIPNYTEEEKKEIISLYYSKSNTETENSESPIKYNSSRETIYTFDLKLWIDTKDAAKANHFMYIVTSALSKIDNVHLELVESSVGSFKQRILLKIKGWLAKEETKQILKKGMKSLEAYSMDRHIEPIEKSKVERKKHEEEIKRMMSEADVKKLQAIEIAKAEEELKAMKLKNAMTSLEFVERLSEVLAKGLVVIDSGYRIELNELTIVKKESGKLEFGSIDKFDDQINITTE